MIEQVRKRMLLRKISNFRKIDGWLSENEALGLYSIARKLPLEAVVVEIGSWQGKSSYCIAKGLQSGKLYAIDPFNKDAGKDDSTQQDYDRIIIQNSLLERFTKNMSDFNVKDKIIVKKGYSYNFHKDFSKIDFLFIDGDHSIEGCKLDYDLYADKILPGGFIAFHDYYPDRPELGPTYVVEQIISKRTEFSFLRKFDSLWIGQKVGQNGL